MKPDNCILHKIPEVWRKEFCRFLETGDASPSFLDYLDEAPECQHALDEAMAAEAGSLATLGAQLAPVFAEKGGPVAVRSPPRRKRLHMAYGGIIAALLVACGYLGSAHSAALQREEECRLQFRRETEVVENLRKQLQPAEGPWFPPQEQLQFAELNDKRYPVDESKQLSREEVRQFAGLNGQDYASQQIASIPIDESHSSSNLPPKESYSNFPPDESLKLRTKSKMPVLPEPENNAKEF
jgi:hypothetical protein